MLRPRRLLWAQGSHRCQQPQASQTVQLALPAQSPPPGPQCSSPHLKDALSLVLAHTPILLERPPALSRRAEPSAGPPPLPAPACPTSTPSQDGQHPQHQGLMCSVCWISIFLERSGAS